MRLKRMESDDCDDDARSDDSIQIVCVRALEVEADQLCYRCLNTDGVEEIYDRADLMDGGLHQKLVLSFERRNPPEWEPCPVCQSGPGEPGCDECECPDCEAKCRFFKGLNYGCPKHPVV